MNRKNTLEIYFSASNRESIIENKGSDLLQKNAEYSCGTVRDLHTIHLYYSQNKYNNSFYNLLTKILNQILEKNYTFIQ